MKFPALNIYVDRERTFFGQVMISSIIIYQMKSKSQHRQRKLEFLLLICCICYCLLAKSGSSSGLTYPSPFNSVFFFQNNLMRGS